MIYIVLIFISLLGNSYTNDKVSDYQENTLVSSLRNYRDNLAKKKIKSSKTKSKYNSIEREFALPGVCATILDNITTIELQNPNTLTPSTYNIQNKIWRYIWKVIRREPGQSKFEVTLSKDASYNFTLLQHHAGIPGHRQTQDIFSVEHIEFEESSITNPNDACLLKVYDGNLDAVLVNIFETYHSGVSNVWFFCVEPRINLKIGVPSAVPGPEEKGDLEINIKFYDLCQNPETELDEAVLGVLKTEYKKV